MTLAVLSAALLLAGSSALGPAAQAAPIYRCGNQYTNTPAAGQRDCKPVEGGNVTIVQPRAAPPAAPLSPVQPSAPRLDLEQAERDQYARRILLQELEKTQARMRELQTEYQEGAPDRLGNERNYQRYLDRKQRLQRDLERTQGDLDSLSKEIERLPAPLP
jgi:hypothetical protein